jgi:hypothetical protein
MTAEDPLGLVTSNGYLPAVERHRACRALSVRELHLELRGVDPLGARDEESVDPRRLLMPRRNHATPTTS